MKILRILGSVNPAHGGPIEAMIRSTEVLSRLGHETEVACLDPPGAPWLGGVGAPVHPFGPGVGRYRFSSAYVAWMERNAGRYDVAVMHGVWNFSSAGAWRSLRRAGTPYVVFTHGMLDPWFRRAFPIKHALKDVYWALIERKVLENAACVFFTSEDERRLARSLYPRARYRDAVTPYGTADAPRPPVGAPGLDADLPALRGRRYLLFLSRIHPKKGCDLAIRAFAEAAADHPDLDLVMAGPDEAGWAAELRALAASLGVGARVHWPGMLSGDAKWAAFRGAEAFLLPSHSENFGIVVAEALACGSPVLITDKVNIWREIERAGAGLVAADDQAGAIDLVRRYLALTDPERAGMRAAARTCFVANFHIEQAAARLADELRAVAAAGR